MMKSVDITSYQFFQLLAQLPFIDKIYLFGSRARGDHRPRSDIDLAIVCPLASSDDWQDIMAIIEHADTLLKIDCLRLDRIADQALLENIKKNNILLFKKR